MGVYLVLNFLNPMYSMVQDYTMLAALMYVIYSLGELNGYEVVLGYTGLWSLLPIAAGATAVGTGWHLGMRRLSIAKYSLPPGGQRATRRIWVPDLVSELLETDILPRQPRPAPPDSSPTFQEILNGQRPNHITNQTSELLHNWHVLSQLSQSVAADDAAERLARLDSVLDRARQRSVLMTQNGIATARFAPHCSVAGGIRALPSTRGPVGGQANARAQQPKA